MIISLGTSCKVREAIQRCLNIPSLESNIFDWLITNFESILYCIQNIDKPFSETDFYDSKEICLSHRIILHKSLRFDSLHDCVASNNYQLEMRQFIDKYNRRLKRLKQHILSNQILDFIHLVDCNYNFRLPRTQLYIPTITQMKQFHSAIQKINPNCNYRLHILIPPEYCKQFNCRFVFDKNQINQLTSHNTFIHYMEQDINKESCKEQCHHWSWEKVFYFIYLKMNNK